MAEEIVQKYGVDIGDVEAKLGRQIDLYERLESSGQAIGKSTNWRKQAEEMDKFNNKLTSGSEIFKKIAGDPKALRDELKRLGQEYGKLVLSQDRVAKSGKWRQEENDIKRVEVRIKELNNLLDITAKKEKNVGSSGGSGGGLGSLLGGIGGKVAGAFAFLGIATSIGAIAGEIKNVTAEFQKYEAILTNTLGSQEKAVDALDMIADLAAKTPYSVSELTGSFVKLANRGLVPTSAQLRSLGDLAASTGKSFDQLTEALLDAMTGEFERLKEFGVKAKTVGDNIIFTFKGQETTVKKSESAIRDYILTLGDLQGVAGSMAAIAGTLDGQISNLGDTFDSLYRAIGDRLAPIFSDLIGLVSKAGAALTEFFKSAEDKSRDRYKAAGAAAGRVAEIDKTIVPLLAVYERLSAKNNRSVAEQKQLEEAIKKVSAAIPSAIAGQDKYGTVLGLNAAKAKDYIQQQRDLARNLQANAATEVTTALEKENKRIDELNKKLVRAQEGFGMKRVDNYTNPFAPKYKMVESKLTNDEQVAEIAKISTELAKASEEADKLANNLAKVTGQAPIEEGKVTPKKEGLTAEQKAKLAKQAEQRQVLLNRAEEKRIEDRKKYEDELVKLEDEANKLKLENLKKYSAEWYNVSLKIELAAIEKRRTDLLEVGQRITGTRYYSTKTKQIEVNPNKNFKLTDDTEAIFEQQRNDARLKVQTEHFEAISKLAKEAREREARNVIDFQAQIDGQYLNGRVAVIAAEAELTRQQGESEEAFELRKQKKLLQIKLEYANKAHLAAIVSDDKNKMAETAEAVNALIGQIKEVDQKVDKLPKKDIYDLLGFTMSDTQKQSVSESIQVFKSGVNELLQMQIQADQERVQAIDKRIDKNKQEREEELELAKRGLASNLLAKQREGAALEAERQKAIDAQRRTQKIQLALNAVEQGSNIAVAISGLLKDGVKKLGLFGVIASGVAIAAMLAVFVKTLTTSRNLPKYHTGDFVSRETVARRSTDFGKPGPGEVDARIRYGEFIVQEDTAKPNVAFLRRVNRLKRKLTREDLPGLLSSAGIDPTGDREMIAIYNAGAGSTMAGVEQRIDGLRDEIRQVVKNTMPGKTRTPLGNGKFLITYANGSTEITNS